VVSGGSAGEGGTLLIAAATLRSRPGKQLDRGTGKSSSTEEAESKTSRRKALQ
jgi:hypothetical protein